MSTTPPPALSNDLFHFHPGTTNPELWRTTVPLVVRERCKRHKGLIATWTAIHWLIVLHAASGRTHFGMREIAEEAGVGRNELAGATGYIQRLVALGLIRIVGYRSFRGLREPRPVYRIDLAELERLSLDLVPGVLRDRHIDRPPPIVPDPRQLQLALVPTDDAATEDGALLLHPAYGNGTAGMAMHRGVSTGRQASHENGTGAPAPSRDAMRTAPRVRGATHETGTASEILSLRSPTIAHGSGTGAHQNGTDQPQIARHQHDFSYSSHGNGTALAQNQDMDGGKERRNEGGSHALTLDLVQSLITQAIQAALTTLQTQGGAMSSDTPPSLTTIPTTPPGAEPLTAPVLTLWQGGEPTLRPRDSHQLALLAAEYDGPTGGYGAYWLGRAILMADLCLGDEPITIAYVRRMLRRWCQEGSWGSDREIAEPAPRATSQPTARLGLTAPSPDEAHHPAVRAYVEALHETPNAVQAAQIVATVSDLAAWRQVLTDWQLNGWGERSVGKMLDRYQKSLTGAVAPSEPPPSVAVIHTYPGVTQEQRERWIRKFHAAATPAEKRAVISRLEQEHPR
jgi:hypothetical protein